MMDVDSKENFVSLNLMVMEVGDMFIMIIFSLVIFESIK